MITPSFGLTATERVLPKLALDFTTASLDSRVTFTRTTGASNPATYVNSSGYVTAATNNQPRFDYDPVTLVCKGLLIEESRQNKCLQSEDFATTWVAVNGSISTNQTTSPANDATADKLLTDASAASHYVNQNIAVTSGTTYTISAFLKAAEYGTAAISVTNAIPLTSVVVNLSNGTATTGTGTPLNTQSINYGNGWWRVSFSVAATSTTNATLLLYAINGTTWADRTLAGNTSSGVYLWGAQLEAGAFATSYIPTTTTALTRNADVATMTGTNFSDWFNASEGTFVAQLNYFGLNNCGLLGVDNGTDSQRMSLQSASSTTMTYRFVSSSGNFASNSSAYTANSAIKAAYTYSAGSQSACVSTNLFAANTQASVATVDRLRIGTARAVNPLNGHIQTIDYYPQKLLNAEIQAFTK